MFQFDGKVVVLTGGGSGIGAAAARAFARAGATLVVGDMNAEGLKALESDLGTDKLLTRVMDTSKAPACEALVQAAVDRFGKIDVLVNDAGLDHMGAVDEGGLDQWERIMGTDLNGYFYMIRFAIPHLRKQKGAIVNVSSVSGLGGDWNHSFYNAAKGAITNFTRALALDEAKHGVRVNAVNPSLVYTSMTEQMKSQPELIKKFEERIPMGRGANPEDIAGPILFLASEAAHFITGVNLPVDGGLTASNGQPAL